MIDMVIAMENIPEIVRYFRDCQVCQILSGTSDIVRYNRDCQFFMSKIARLVKDFQVSTRFSCVYEIFMCI